MLTVKLSTPKVTVEKEFRSNYLSANASATEGEVLAAAEKAGKVQRVKGGTICVYGLNTRFPLALYPNQWEELAPVMPAILEFIKTGRENGTIVERDTEVTDATSERVPLKRIDPVVAAIMTAKGVDATEATRIAKSSGFLK